MYWSTWYNFFALVQLGLSATTYAVTFNEQFFHDKLDKAIKAAENILDETRLPKLFVDEDHSWDDKYAIAEHITHAAILTAKKLLERILSVKDLQNLDPRTQVRCEMVITCDLVDESERPILARSTDKIFGQWMTSKYYWRITVVYQFDSCPLGSCSSERLNLVKKENSIIVSTPTKLSPFRRKVELGHELNLVWLLGMLGTSANTSLFSINRELKSCRTPRRNDDITMATTFFEELGHWSHAVRDLFYIFGLYAPSTVNFAEVFHIKVYLPILPLLEKYGRNDSDFMGSLFLQLETTLNHKLHKISEQFIDADTKDYLFKEHEAQHVVVLETIESLVPEYNWAIELIEDNIEALVTQAIGKHLTQEDFDDFMRFYNRKVFQTNYASSPYAYAVRRPEHYPDGLVSIEEAANKPLETLVRKVKGGESQPISIPISAGTTVEITGDRYLHGILLHRFEEKRGHDATLVARARQFSSFMLLVGSLTGPDEFQPKHAIILKNKDEIMIPLLMEVLPSAKEFKKAISSLSPEQQAFAKEIRSMQLESSAFSICIVQIKPQLEKLLGLTEGTLSTDIRLSEDLILLFVDYQIPSDLLKFDGPGDANATQRLDAVKGRVKAVLNVIESIESDILEEKAKQDCLIYEPQGSVQNHISQKQSISQTVPSSGQQPSAMRSAMRSAVPSAVPSAAPSAAPSDTSTFEGEHAPSEAPSLAPQINSVSEKSSVTSKRHLNSQDADSAFDDLRTDIHDGRAVEDLTLIPKLLDKQLEINDKNGVIKTTIIKASGEHWVRRQQENILSPMKVTRLFESQVERETNKAFDLLDALSRSGTLAINSAEMHVIVGVTHCFVNTIMGTLVQDNVDLMEKVETSLLLLGSIIYGESVSNLVSNNDMIQGRLKQSHPALFSDSNNTTIMKDKVESDVAVTGDPTPETWY